MSHWNHRVIEFEGLDGPEYGIVEAYYDNDNKLVGHTDPMVVGESIENLRVILKWMEGCLDQPIIPDMSDEHENVENAR